MQWQQNTYSSEAAWYSLFCTIFRSNGTAPTRPRFHQLSPLFKQVASPIGRLHLVGDDVSKRRFGDLTREGRLFGGPIPEGRAEAVRGQIGVSHAFQQL